jgi:Phytanoyl-CoA dioxygenase (PhyH)
LGGVSVERFVTDGFVALRGAVPRAVVDECAAILFEEAGVDPADPATWTQPVIRLGGHAEPPFVAASMTPVLGPAYDQLVGAGRYRQHPGLGTFPIRFPVPGDPGDTGWHVDGSFTPPGADLFHLNLRSRGRALLMLFLLTDVGEDDAPTRIRVGSHLDVPRLLEPAGEAGLSFMDLGARLGPTEARPIALATGAAGDVYLCHPFLVHAAQVHRGTRPRIIAQPGLAPVGPLVLDRADGDHSPVEQAVRIGLGLAPSAG